MFGFIKKNDIYKFIENEFGDHLIIARLKKEKGKSICAYEGSLKELCSLLIDFALSSPDMKNMMYAFCQGFIKTYEEEQVEEKGKKKNGKGKN